MMSIHAGRNSWFFNLMVVMSKEKSFHMTSKEFRKWGKSVVDWIADYYENIESYPVLSQVRPNEIRQKLPAQPPENGEPFDEILNDINKIILPGITHWQSPNFFAFFPANTSGPAILGEMISAGLGVQGMLWATSPACTELETHVMDWLVDGMGLPQKFKSNSTGGGVIQDSASSATLCALLSARERITQFKSNEEGTDGKLVVYASSQTHSSLEKAVKIAGIGSKQLRFIDVDEHYAMNPKILLDQIEKDKQAGLTPCFVCATLGTTSSNAFDPVPEIGQICRDQGLWLHVDGAMSGTAAICEEYRHIIEGLELVDSYCFNPHKWMFTNFDCDCFYVADRAELIKTLSVLPEYLKNQATESGAVIDYRDWHVPLGRRFRALKLWFVIRYYGLEGLRHHVREHVRLAQEFVGWVNNSAEFELAAPAPLNLICFRHKDGDTTNRNLMDHLNEDGKIYLTHTTLDDKFTLRFCIGQTQTQSHHVEQAWELITQTAGEINHTLKE